MRSNAIPLLIGRNLKPHRIGYSHEISEIVAIFAGAQKRQASSMA
jgi:hypothetical protein